MYTLALGRPGSVPDWNYWVQFLPNPDGRSIVVNGIDIWTATDPGQAPQLLAGGAQAGGTAAALTAAELTNLRLVTWEEFQASFEQTWLDRYFIPTITTELDPLFTYIGGGYTVGRFRGRMDTVWVVQFGRL